MTKLEKAIAAAKKALYETADVHLYGPDRKRWMPAATIRKVDLRELVKAVESGEAAKENKHGHTHP